MKNVHLLLSRADEVRPVLADGVPARAVPTPVPSRSGPLPFEASAGDPDSLPAQRWGIIAPEGAEGDRLIEAIQPLRDLRARAQGSDALVLRCPPGMDEDAAIAWRDDVLHAPDIYPADRPRYLLLLGDLHQVSLELQQVLALDAYPGRLAFDDVGSYAAYAEKVARWETQPVSEIPRALFFTAHDGSLATTVGHSALVLPAMVQCQVGRSKGDFSANIVEIGSRPRAPGREVLFAEAGRRVPSLLFSLSHGLGAPRAGWGSADEQREKQGQLVLGDRRTLDLSALGDEPFLPGGAWFLFACFGAGTPGQSAYRHWLAELARSGAYDRRVDEVLAGLPRGGARPFIARTPRVALANPNGPLTVVGHIDLAWSYSFQEPGRPVGSNPARLFEVVRALLQGHRAGPALGALMRFTAMASHDLTTAYDRAKRAGAGDATAVDELKAHLWMLRQDLGAYVLLGDPAARLPLTA